MSKSKEIKTNAMRILDKNHIEYKVNYYECDNFQSGTQVADMLHMDYENIFKTLVTKGNTGNYFVFVIPIAMELDLKKAARSVSEKSLCMLPVKEINTVTGYIRGGCTAIGMKKQYVTRISSFAQNMDEIIISGGHIGIQLTLKPGDFVRICNAEYAELTVD